MRTTVLRIFPTSLSNFSSVTLIRPSVTRCNDLTELSSDSKQVRISFLTFSKLANVR